MDLSALFSNPTSLIVLAVLAFGLFGGSGSVDMLLKLLQSLKLIPQPQAPPSRQLFEQWSAKAWDALQDGKSDAARQYLESATTEAAEAITQESAVRPAGIGDTITSWLKSPLALIVIGLAVLMLAGKGCSPEPQSLPQEAPAATAE